MKKLLITWLAFIACVAPLLAQVDHDYNPNDVVIPDASFTLKNDQIPPVVFNAANTSFKLSDQTTWTKFPYAIKEYGWVYDKNSSDNKPDYYEVSMKTDGGNEFYAVYSANGTLVATRETSINILLPSNVQESLSKSIYKDWKMIGNKEVIKYFHDTNSVSQYIRLTLEKDNVRRSISFNYQETGNK